MTKKLKNESGCQGEEIVANEVDEKPEDYMSYNLGEKCISRNMRNTVYVTTGWIPWHADSETS